MALAHSGVSWWLSELARTHGARRRGQGGVGWLETGGAQAHMAETGAHLPPPAYGAMRESEWKERDRDSGSFVNNLKFKTQF